MFLDFKSFWRKGDSCYKENEYVEALLYYGKAFQNIRSPLAESGSYGFLSNNYACALINMAGVDGLQSQRERDTVSELFELAKQYCNKEESSYPLLCENFDTFNRYQKNHPLFLYPPQEVVNNVPYIYHIVDCPYPGQVISPRDIQSDSRKDREEFCCCKIT